MAREGIRFELTNAFQRATLQKGKIMVWGAKVAVIGGTQEAGITIQSSDEPDALRGMVMIVSNDVKTPSEKKAATRPKPGAADSARGLDPEREQPRLANA
jgi:two-component system CheB/CheR fusion protein